MAADLSDGELQYWIAKECIEPSGERAADARAGMIASTIANCHRSSETRPFRSRDFLPWRRWRWKKPKRELSDAELSRKILRVFAPMKPAPPND